MPILSTSRYRAIFHILIGAFMISFSSIWVALAHVSPMVSAFYRVFFGFLFLLIATISRHEFRMLSSTSACLILICGLAFAFDLFFWHTSIRYVGPGLATILGNFQVFLLAGCGTLFFGEHLRRRFLLAVPLALFGLFLVVGGNWQVLGDQYKSGIYFGLLTALCYTVFLLSLRRIQSISQHYSLFQALMLVSLACSIILGLYMWKIGESFAIPTLSSLICLLCLGLFSQTIGWVMIANAMPKVRPSLTGLILLLQPALSFVWDVLLFSRPTTWLHWLGVAITLVAIYLGLTGSAEKTSGQHLANPGE